MTNEDLRYFVDYPGYDGKAPPDERLHNTLEEALDAAKGIYRDSDVGKVVVCSFPGLARVAGVWGDRLHPEVHSRSGAESDPGGSP